MTDTASLIQDTADLIGQYDAGAARVFLNQPFHRVLIAKAFRSGFRTHSAQTLTVCDLVDRTAALDVQIRAL